ncbi:outer membrane protein assembly factor BamB family protein [Bremerella alba]|uniref:Outer membrane protein assembly factor BamB n=1 Tax=Bremerella alba TaxID=980252 RepID=A0A7V8V1Y3_9BACT|nr:PQQ-binding-like beta-propeller repeat protein [Bremerella alba]MBA2113386.1 Outer membrane protein assembly factor BamB [Bremerella alba]
MMIEISIPAVRFCWTLFLVLFIVPAALQADESAWKPLLQGSPSDWPAWRGPEGIGFSPATTAPTKWGEQENVAWKTPLGGWGDSTPAIVGDHVFVTLQNEANELRLVRLDAKTGQIELNILVDQAETPRKAPKRKTQKFHNLHNLASPSPVVSGEHVVVHFGNGLLATYNLDGEELWRHNLQEEYGTYSIWWGHANSPVVFDGLVISVCMQDSLSDLQDEPAKSYLIAHDLKTGEKKWMTLRMTGAPAEEADAYTTPLLLKKDDQVQMVVMGGNTLDAYNPLTGKRLWNLPGLVGGRTVTGPISAEGKIFTTRGMRKPLLSVKLDGNQGELTEDAIVWEIEKSTPDTPSPVYANGMLFTVTDDGIAHCYRTQDGELLWRERLGGNFKASPIVAGGNVYYTNIDGNCKVVAAKDMFELVSENEVKDTTIASPAIAGGKLFLRGKEHLYCIEK